MRLPNPYEMVKHQIEDEHREAAERLANQAGKGGISTTRKTFRPAAAVMAWMVRLVGGGGGI